MNLYKPEHIKKHITNLSLLESILMRALLLLICVLLRLLYILSVRLKALEAFVIN